MILNIPVQCSPGTRLADVVCWLVSSSSTSLYPPSRSGRTRTIKSYRDPIPERDVDSVILLGGRRPTRRHPIASRDDGGAADRRARPTTEWVFPEARTPRVYEVSSWRDAKLDFRYDRTHFQSVIVAIDRPSASWLRRRPTEPEPNIVCLYSDDSGRYWALPWRK